MSRLSSLLLACSLVLLATGGKNYAATRVALIVSAGAPEVRSVLDLATAELSKESGVELLERAAIDRVLTEQKLTLGSVADAGQAVAAGKILSADVLAVVEVAPDGKAALGLVVFDAKTGLRLWDAALPAGALDKQAVGVVDGLKGALKKHAAGRDGLRTVGFMAVRNADLPRPMDSFCDALGELIERRLVASPAVGVLERQRLEAVTGERALATQAAEKELLGSLVQLDLEVRRGPQGEGLRATVLLSDAKGKQIGKVSYQVKESDPADAADTFAKGICEALKATPAAANGDVSREGTRFLTEARRLWTFHQQIRALRAAEAAHALAPKDMDIRALLVRFLITQGGDTLSPQRPFVSHKLTPEANVVAHAAGLVQRGIDLRSVALSQVKPNDLKALIALAADLELEQELTICLHKFAALDNTPLKPEAKEHVTDLMASIERWLCDEYLEKFATAAENNSAAFGIYSSQLLPRVNQLRWAAPDAERFTRKLIAVTQRWLDVAAKVKNAHHATVVPWFMYIVTTEVAKTTTPIRWSPGPRELELYEGLFDKMEKHPYPLIRFQGQCSHLWAARLTKRKTPEECYQSYLVAKRELLEAFQDKRSPTNDLEWVSFCTLAHDILIWDLFRFKDAEHQTDEIYDLSEMMLSRKLLVPNLISAAISEDLKPLPKPARKLDLLDRTLTAFDNPAFRYFGEDPKQTKGLLIAYRSRFLAANPDLASKQAPLPWDKSQVLLDLADLRGIRELKFPVVLGEDIYVTGLGGVQGKLEFIQPVRVPLNGKPVQPLAKVSLVWKPLPRNPVGSAIPTKITGCQLGSKHLYVATRTEGLYDFPLNGDAARRIDDPSKMPSEPIESCALYDGRLYLGLDGGYLISMDPESGKFDVLASSRRKDKVSPFDDGDAFIVMSLVADPKRERLLFVLLQGRTKPKSLNGLWSLDPKSKEFTHLLETNGIEYPMSSGMVIDNRLFLASVNKAVEYDLATNKHTLLYAWGDPQDKVLDQKTAHCQETFRGQPASYRDGRMWMTYPLGVVSIEAKKYELLPEPPRSGKAPGGNAEAIVPVGKDQLLYGTTNALWLLSLRKD